MTHLALFSLHRVAEHIRNLKTLATNDKIEYLRKALEKDDIFRRCLVACYSEKSVFHITKFTDSYEALNALLTPDKVHKALEYFGIQEVQEDAILLALKKLAQQTGVSDKDKYYLSILSAVDSDTYAVVLMICNKDMCCNISVKTINKARHNLIHETPYQRCSTMSAFNNIQFDPEAIIQCKANGMFAYCICTPSGVSFTSRNGKDIKQLDVLKNKLLNPGKLLKFGRERSLLSYVKKEPFVLMGELRVFNKKGEIMPRKEGNGILSSCIHGTAQPEHLDNVFYTVWDYISLGEFRSKKSARVYRDRWYTTAHIVQEFSDPSVLRLIEFAYVKNKSECNAFYEKMVQQGEEGAIVKDLKTLWKDHTSTTMVKMKPSYDCDLEISGVIEHTKKKGWMGSLILKSSDGKVQVNVGSGFTDEQRQMDWESLKGKIVSIETEGLIKDKNSPVYSLYTPSFIELRTDKTEADSFTDISSAISKLEGRSRWRE